MQASETEEPVKVCEEKKDTSTWTHFCLIAQYRIY